MPTELPPIVGVMGSGSESHSDLATEVAELLIEFPASLLTGGGGGVMTSVAKAYVESPRRGVGISIGIIPCLADDPIQPKQGYPNPYIELPILTHLPLSGDRGNEIGSRNHINILTPVAVIALPGGPGTASEVALALRYRKPVIIFCSDLQQVAQFPAEVERATTVHRLREFLNHATGTI